MKDIQNKTIAAEMDAQDAMTDISGDINATREAMKAPIETINEGLSSTQIGLMKAKADVEKGPARIDTALDTLGSMDSQSTDDMRRFAEAGTKILFNLKIAGYVAKENKDLMVGNRDAGEYVAQTALDIRRKLGMVSRRMTNAGAEHARSRPQSRSRSSRRHRIDPVIERAEDAVKRVQAVRDALDAVLVRMDETMYVPWNERKRAAWSGDGPVQWPEGR